ncbi:MAG: FdhF/YdeP family oxidoreductase [Deltaproteobacteria bacterium]|nr:FdhF/YdeP family oxidoreductase [Deltaproteobacteria bacterium]
MDKGRKSEFLSPEVLEENIAIGKPAESAGGLSAVTAALKMSVAQMGVGRAVTSLLAVNQKKGFDCPGCAWPDPDDRRSLVEFCENGAKAVAEEATLRRVTPEVFALRSVEELSRESDYWLSQQGRLTHPMYLPRGQSHYLPISWEDAFLKIATELKALESPNEAAFYTSGRTSNEAAFLYQLFVRLFGTNNLPDCSNMCHESSGLGLTKTIGSGKGTVSLKDFDYADCIVVIGQNPGTNHPRMLTTLQAAARRGCRIISINPLAETGLKKFRHPQELSGIFGKGTPLATHFLPVKINGDVALLKGIQKAILETSETLIDVNFIKNDTEGFEAYRTDLLSESWKRIVEGSGISEEQIREVAEVIAKSKAMICCWAMGLTQHQNAVANIQEIVNLLLLGGHFGRPGAGACPVRGHSNVQGDRTMGIWERPTSEFLNSLGKEFLFTPPAAHGYDTIESIEAMHQGKVKVFIGLGGNFLSATPDTAYTAKALNRCSMTVQVSTKLNRSHLITGEHALILPCLGRTEIDLQQNKPQFVTVENSMGIVHSSEGHLTPASKDLKSEPAIIAGLAKATLGVNWEGYIANYDEIRERISRVIPGFENFNHKVRKPGGFVLPHAVRDRKEFFTPSKRAIFTVHSIPHLEVAAGQFIMATIRSHDQYNTTIYGMEDRYRGIHQGRRVVLMNIEDMKEQNLSEGEPVDLISHFRGVKRRAKNFRIVTYEIPRGCVASYFPETNVLIPIDSFAEGSQTPTSKSVIISLEKVNLVS